MSDTGNTLTFGWLSLVMPRETNTVRTRRTWLERLKMWGRAYETKIRDEGQEAIGRGATRETSQEAAERDWVAKQAEKND
jgi:hypothetical protein